MNRGLRDHLVAALKIRGLSVTEIPTESNTNIIMKRLFTAPPFKVPLHFRLYASYAAHLVQKFQPKVILTDKNGSPLSPFLKLCVEPYGRLVHVAHSVTTDNFTVFGMIDYHYYFLFGQSSLDKLKNRDVLFGSAKAVLTGPFLADQDFTLPPTDPYKHILLFGIGPNLEKYTNYRNMYDIVKKWILANQDYTLHVKVHPRSDYDYWESCARSLANVKVLPKSWNMVECLRNVSVVLSIYTNAVIDAALLNRPSLLVCNDEIKDELDVEKFFFPRARTEQQLSENIKKILSDYETYLVKARKFARYHLQHEQDSVDYIADCVSSISRGAEEFPVVELVGKSGV